MFTFTVWVDLYCEASGLPDIQLRTPVLIGAEFCPAEPDVGIMRDYLEDINVDAFQLAGETKEKFEEGLLLHEDRLEELLWERFTEAKEKETAYLKSLEEDAAESNWACRTAYAK